MDPVTLFMMVVFASLAAAVAVAYRRREKNPRLYAGIRNGAVAAFAFSIVIAGSLPSYASLSLDLDMQPLFDSISEFVTVFLPVFSIGGGISIAVVLVTMIIASIVGAIKKG